MEGHPHAVQVITDLLTSYGNEVCRIDAAAKPEYHAAASILSNQVIAVLDTGYRLLEDCGFPAKSRCGNCCTGPSEHRKCALAGLCPCTDRSHRTRGCIYCRKHLQVLNPEDAALYRMLGTRLLTIAKEKIQRRTMKTWSMF